MSLADMLMREFGSIARFINTEPGGWGRVFPAEDPVAELMAATKNVLGLSLASADDATPIRIADQGLRSYLVATMGELDEERVRVFFLDAAHRLISEEEMAHGSVDRVRIYPRTIFRRALQKGAAAVLIVHNHPSRNAVPSPEDIEITNCLSKLGDELDVKLVDHLLVAGTQIVSIMGKKI